MTELLELPWHEARAQASPRELVDASLAAARNDRLNAFLRVAESAPEGQPIAVWGLSVCRGFRGFPLHRNAGQAPHY